VAQAKSIIVIGTSAGGVEALITLAKALPADLPAAVFIVLHLPPEGTSLLPEILTRSGRLPATHAVDGERYEEGHIYVAPPNKHLILGRSTLRLTQGPRENRMRPAIDVLFRSAAECCAERTIGVVLTGSLNDGTAGLLALKKAGAITIVQDPSDAVWSEMPLSAQRAADPDHVLPLRDIAEQLTASSQGLATRIHSSNGDSRTMEKHKGANSIGASRANSSGAAKTPAISGDHAGEVQQDFLEQETGERDKETTVYTCPDCGGVLWQFNEGGLVRFRCHVGHSMSAEDLVIGQSEKIEETLWMAVRSLQEQAALARQIAVGLREKGDHIGAGRFEERAVHAEQDMTILRQKVLDAGPVEASEERR
jgi:two-component system, chemotaxis family, protein-glutamate methylesterase/glutaminase